MAAYRIVSNSWTTIREWFREDPRNFSFDRNNYRADKLNIKLKIISYIYWKLLMQLNQYYRIIN